MKPPVDPVRVSSLGREQLIKLKRQTGIENWNILCRWALCCSLRERSAPPNVAVGSEGVVEMSWRVFGGEQADVYTALVCYRSAVDGFGSEPDGVAQCFRAHLHRGLGYLASEAGTLGIAGFLQRWLHNRRFDK